MMDSAQGNSIHAGSGVAKIDIWTSKAHTLARLAPQLRASRVPAWLSIDYAQWCVARRRSLARIQLHFAVQALAVRSSRHGEDSPEQSQAGRYRTELGVPADSAKRLSTAIDEVFRSYGHSAPNDEVLLQPMVADARACYVAATHTVDEGAPYYVLDFAPGERTDLVTHGECATTTIYLAHGTLHRDLHEDHRKILGALRELEQLHPSEPLEAEFVLAGHEVILLQVRPIVLASSPGRSQTAAVLRKSLRRKLARREIARGGVLGNSTLYGLMPDWNPAELLGAHPRPLALSLFRRLITNANWRRARMALGYRALAGGDLLVPLLGRPYVDVRLSFNSFLPAGIDVDSGARLVDAWLARLQAAPSLHDKVEFEIASTCLDFDFVERHRLLYPGVLKATELQAYGECSLTTTRCCLDQVRLHTASASLQRLQQSLLVGTKLHHGAALLHRLQRATRDGAKPYAQIARQAFVIEAILRSAQRRGALSVERLLALRRSVVGVTGEFIDLWGSADDTQSLEDLRQRFGHLRPGTFEISVPCYAAQEALFLSGPAQPAAKRARQFAWTPAECSALNKLALESGLDLDATALLSLYRAAVLAREQGKFVLAQAVSCLLEDIAHFGRARGLDRDALTWLDIACIFADVLVDYRAIAAEAKRRYEDERLLKLPVLMSAHEDLSVVRCLPGTPNFQGRGVVEARIIEVNRHTRPAQVPLHCVIAIESADPGFDWIFARAPAALLTAYGGPNSHMAIRCGELHCPAVLGIGAEGLRRALRCLRLVVDFDSGTLRGAGE